VRPKIRALVRKTDVPENLWDKCPACGQMIFHRELEANLGVCQHCGHHMRIDVKRRLELLFDEGKYARIPLPKPEIDPLKFRDRKKYVDRLKDTQAKTGEQDALIVAEGTIGGHRVVPPPSISISWADPWAWPWARASRPRPKRAAVAANAALIAIPASGGARMQEGILSLMQMPRTAIAVDLVKEAGLPFIVLLTDPTTGGVSASFAMLGDIHMAEPGAIIGFAGQRVIEETIRAKLPEGFQRAEYLLEHGIVDLVVARKDLPRQLARVIGLLTQQSPSAA
jgi:acetyl-CoA carboxylase carboxyl transferase subunit beta